MTKPLSRIETPTESYVIDYPQAIEAATSQMAIFWPAEELGVEEDVGDFHNKLTEGEREGILTLQTVLTQYELMIGGEEMWGGRIQRLFPRPHIQRACAVFAMVELNSHAPFYDLINQSLDLATDEFYTTWKRDEDLSKHIAWIDEQASSGDALEATAALAFLEGVMLFSAFAFFKSFSRPGFKLIPHFVAGIDGSAKDENYHSMFSAWLHNTCKKERIEAGNMDKFEQEALDFTIWRMARDVYDHEFAMIERIFAKAPETIRVVTKEEMQHFIRDRVNVVLNRLGMPNMFEQESGVISSWFYTSLSSYKFADFFAGTQLQYTRNWAKHKLGFNQNLANELSGARDLSALLKPGE